MKIIQPTLITIFSRNTFLEKHSHKVIDWIMKNKIFYNKHYKNFIPVKELIYNLQTITSFSRNYKDLLTIFIYNLLTLYGDIRKIYNLYLLKKQVTKQIPDKGIILQVPLTIKSFKINSSIIYGAQNIFSLDIPDGILKASSTRTILLKTSKEIEINNPKQDFTIFFVDFFSNPYLLTYEGLYKVNFYLIDNNKYCKIYLNKLLKNELGKD